MRSLSTALRRERVQHLALAGVIAVVAGCATAPARVEPTEDFTIPNQWSAQTYEDGAAETDWWDEFKDTELASAVLEAVEHNHDIRAAAARMDRAAATAKIVGADSLPQAQIVGDGSRAASNLTFLPNQQGVQLNQFGVSLDVTWEIDLWGRLRAGQSAALGDWERSVADYEAARLSIAGQTAKAWIAAIEAREQLELAEHTVASFQTTAHHVRSRYERGVRPALDLRLARTDVFGAQALVDQRKEALDRSVRQLEILMGRYPDRALDVSTDMPGPVGHVPAGLPTELLQRRPDLVAAERRLAASGARVKEARRALYPRISLNGSYGDSSNKVSDVLDVDFNEWTLAGNLAQPIFQGGRLLAALDRSKAEQLEAAEDYATATLSAYAEVESLLAAARYLADRVDRQSLAATESSAARDLAEQRYLRGLEEFVTVLAAQRTALNAASELIAVRRARLESRIDLYLALGGGFDAALHFDAYADSAESGS